MGDVLPLGLEKEMSWVGTYFDIGRQKERRHLWPNTVRDCEKNYKYQNDQ